MPIFQRRTGCRRPKRTRRLDPLKLNSLAKVQSVTADQSFGLTSQCLGKAREPRTPSFQAVRSPRGGPAWTERGNGHRTSCSAGWRIPLVLRVIRHEPRGRFKGRRGSPRPRATPVSLTCRRCRWQISWPMGVQQYARMLGLSRGQHYLLYPKQLTLQMPHISTGGRATR